jgi:hypothetical protein
MEAEMKNAELRRRKQGYYKPGEGFNLCVAVADPNLCRAGCGGTDHKTKQSKKCPLNLSRLREKADVSKQDLEKEIEILRKQIQALEAKQVQS